MVDSIALESTPIISEGSINICLCSRAKAQLILQQDSMKQSLILTPHISPHPTTGLEPIYFVTKNGILLVPYINIQKRNRKLFIILPLSTLRTKGGNVKVQKTKKKASAWTQQRKIHTIS